MGLKELSIRLNSASLDDLEDLRQDGQFVYCEDVSSDDEVAAKEQWKALPCKRDRFMAKVVNLRDKILRKKQAQPQHRNQPCRHRKRNSLEERGYRMLQLFRRCKNDEPPETMWLSNDASGAVVAENRESVFNRKPILENLEFIKEIDCPEEEDYVILGKEDSIPDSSNFSLKICYKDVQKIKLIGQGGFGMVYEGELNGKPIAMKEVASHHYQHEQGKIFINSLLLELKVLQRLGRHPHVVECYGGCLKLPNVFMISRLMERSLGDLIYGGRNSEGMGPLPAEMALGITLDILHGLNHLHCADQMVVHRDLKPQNILLDKSNRALVTDFGMSRVKAGSYLQTLNAHAGTSAYLGPEVSTGKINEKLDIFATGVILWECLTGEHPWKGCHPFATHFAVRKGERLPMHPSVFSENEAAVTYAIKKIIQQCWQELPRMRPTCKELIERIQDLMSKFFGDYPDKLCWSS